MAARKKKQSAAELTGNSDPRAPLDAEALLAAAKPLLKTLAADLLARADDSAAVTVALQARHAREQKAERTADAYSEWRRAFVEQVAAAWVLSCVFVRTLEDRGLLGRNRIAGPGAEDSWRAFLQLAPSLSAREYLLTVFRELTHLPAAAGLFDARHNPVWLLAPSADAARQLLDLFRSPHTEAPTFRFGGDDTRFLGDLYQDLSEDVRKRYALLQTPRFVESFILDRTLEPAIERFGLNETNLIDPTCGSGHLLLGTFERLFDHRLRAEPGLSAREAATKALDAIAGADINPYAIAIARFRLTLAFIEKCGFTRLKDVPKVPLHLAVADSLIYNPHIPQLALAPGADPSRWEGDILSFEDPEKAREVLFKQYAAVVGNPPYITVKDAKLRERYRSHYTSAAGKYSIAVPFTERMFQLARSGGSVGMITANSFMKREFGKRLIETYLKTVNLSLIVNTSGAYIPGHGTPTVLLFGTSDKPQGADVLTVLSNRGEPTTPKPPENGLVWSSLASHWNEVGFENDYISVARVDRKSLEKHPWSLGGGGTGELKELLEERVTKTLGDLAESIGISCVTGEDDVYLLPPDVVGRLNIGATRPLVTGEFVRDWGLSPAGSCVFPYADDFAVLSESSAARELNYLWPYRAILGKRKRFGTPMLERGLTWYELQELYADKLRTPLVITFAFVSTHNHFVLDRGGKVFKQTAPIIKLPETSTEDDHLALLAYLNSSIACFWMKQVGQARTVTTGEKILQPDPAKLAFEFSATQLGNLPIPEHAHRDALIHAARELLSGGSERVSLRRELTLTADGVVKSVRNAEKRDNDLLARMTALQEAIDVLVYADFGLLSLDVETAVRFAIEYIEDPAVAFAPELRGFAREVTDRLGHALRSEATASDTVRLLEDSMYKRRWIGVQGRFDGKGSTLVQEWMEVAISQYLSQVEHLASRETRTCSVRNWLTTCDAAILQDLSRYGASKQLDLAQVISQESVAYLSACVFSESGMEKRQAWEAIWAAQRVEDAGGSRTLCDPPSKYDAKDFRDSNSFRLRGKLDVPKERFISYPGCESDEDKEPVYGWAGWDHLQRAVALAGLYQDRKQREGWNKDRLKPMLAGLLELLPWLKQWHNEPNADLGGEKPCDQFEAFLNAECAEHGFTHDDLRAWRPAAKGSAGSKKKSKAKNAAPTSAEAGEE